MIYKVSRFNFFRSLFDFFSLEARLTYLSYVSKVCNLGFSKNCKKKVMYSCNLSLKCINCSSQHHETHRFFLLWSDWNWTEKFWKNCKTNDDIMFEAALAAKVIIHTSRAVRYLYSEVPNKRVGWVFWVNFINEYLGLNKRNSRKAEPNKRVGCKIC